MLLPVLMGRPEMPNMVGTLGPYMSASSRPTLLPSFRKHSARFAATVLLPTPPLPLMTRTISFAPGTGSSSAMARMRRHVGPAEACVNSERQRQHAMGDKRHRARPETPADRAGLT